MSDDKISIEEFARIANVDPFYVEIHYDAWELAAEDGLVPPGRELLPGQEFPVSLPDSKYREYILKAAAAKGISEKTWDAIVDAQVGLPDDS